VTMMSTLTQIWEGIELKDLQGGAYSLQQAPCTFLGTHQAQSKRCELRKRVLPTGHDPEKVRDDPAYFE
jgi:hypothetical protein